MIELKIKCESVEEARVYLNGPQYHNLISDLHQSIRNAQKHGTEHDLIRVISSFYPDLAKAMDNSEGAY
jgi:hypothetical protein